MPTEAKAQHVSLKESGHVVNLACCCAACLCLGRNVANKECTAGLYWLLLLHTGRRTQPKDEIIKTQATSEATLSCGGSVDVYLNSKEIGSLISFVCTTLKVRINGFCCEQGMMIHNYNGGGTARLNYCPLSHEMSRNDRMQGGGDVPSVRPGVHSVASCIFRLFV